MLKVRRLPKWNWRTGRFRFPVQLYDYEIAAVNIPARAVLTRYPDGRVGPIQSKSQNIVGVALESALKDEAVRVVKYGEVEIKPLSQ